MTRFTDLDGPAPDALPGFPGVFVRHGTLDMHRQLTEALPNGYDGPKSSDEVYAEDRAILQLLFDQWLVDEDGTPFVDVSGENPEVDIGKVSPGTLIGATLALLKRRNEGNVEPAGTS